MRLMRWMTAACYDGADGNPGGTPGAAPGAPGGAPAGGTPQAPWYQGKADDTIVGHWQNLGWHTKTPEEIAILATRSHREAQGYIGVPTDKLIRLPAQPGDAQAWGQVYSKLGKPSDAQGYDFKDIKHVDDKPLDAKWDTALRTVALESNLTKDQATSAVRGIVKHLDDMRSAELAEKQNALAEEKKALDKNWGLNKAQNLLVAQSGARALGISEAEVNALENVVGYSRVMEMLRHIGTKMGEDQFIEGKGPGGSGVMTREQAIARKDELMKDKAWAKAYLAGDAEKGREMTNLIAIINSGS